MRIDQRRAIVRATSLLAIEVMQSHEETRYYLNGAFIEAQPEGALLVATDGHVLMAMQEKDALVSGLNTIWNHQVTDRLTKPLATFRKEYSVRLQTEDLWCDMKTEIGSNGSISVVLAKSAADVSKGEGQVLLNLPAVGLEIDGTFPDWRRVMPRGDVSYETPAWFQANLLERVIKVARIVSGVKSPAIQTHSYGIGAPARFAIGGALHVGLVVMPMRGDRDNGLVLQDWLSEACGTPVPDDFPTEAALTAKRAEAMAKAA